MFLLNPGQQPQLYITSSSIPLFDPPPAPPPALIILLMLDGIGLYLPPPDLELLKGGGGQHTSEYAKGTVAR